MTLAVIALGGALGATMRYLASVWIQSLAGGAFPWGTWTVNLLGSLVLGFAMVWLHHTLTSGELRYFVVVGLLGSFTTFSTYSLETVEMLREGMWWRAGAYGFGSVLLGVAAVMIGAGFAALVFRPTP